MEIAIRKLTADDWREFARIRLRALQSDPKVFGSNYKRESEFAEADWRERLAAANNAIFLLSDGETPIGITAFRLTAKIQQGKPRCCGERGSRPNIAAEACRI